MSWYRGSKVLDDAEYLAIEYRIAYTRLLSSIRKLELGKNCK